MEIYGLQEIVALSGAHTLGRSRPDRSGWGKPETKYTVIDQIFFLLNWYILDFLIEKQIPSSLHAI